jgi:hypothetical protein
VFRVRVEELNLKLAAVPGEAARAEGDPNRPPSPPPEYDSTGKRTNSREQRITRTLLGARDKLLERMADLNPALVSGPAAKFQRKLYIPWRKYPSYNFIGLIIGPRGNTQKKLEKETGCKIAVRGRGSGKEARVGEGGGRPARKPSSRLPLHCAGEGFSARTAGIEGPGTLHAFPILIHQLGCTLLSMLAMGMRIVRIFWVGFAAYKILPLPPRPPSQ